MKAVVMAGGEGSRLRPLTIDRPKPMVPMVTKPVIGHILDLLKRHGITEVVVTLHYLPEDIQDYFGDGHSLGMKIYYAVEETPLGTAGSVKNAQQYLDEPFLVISGDAVTDINLQQVIDFHQAKKADATLTLYRVPNPLEYGVIITDQEGKITQFLEKPSWGEVISDTVNTGIYVIDPVGARPDQAGRAHRLEQGRLPQAAGGRASPLRLRGRRLLVRRRQHRRVYAHQRRRAQPPRPGRRARPAHRRQHLVRRRAWRSRPTPSSTARSTWATRSRSRAASSSTARRPSATIPSSTTAPTSTAASSGATPTSAKAPRCAAPSSAGSAPSRARPCSSKGW